MKTSIYVTAIIAGFVASAAAAQTSTFDNQGAAADAVDDLQEAIDDDARDIGRIGNAGREIGSYGSVALRYTATTNDGDKSNDLGAGLRYGWFDGVNGFDMNLSYAYSEDNGTQSDNLLLAGFDYRRDLNASLFAYAQADIAIDKLTTTPDEYTQDIFVGAGIGYRIYDTAALQWSVQAGPGWRRADVVGGEQVSEAAASVSSNLFFSLTDTTYVTNDTDVIYSDFATTVSNDLALNVSLTDSLLLRTSYATRYNDLTDTSFSDAENTLGLSVVYNFN
jgi:putative salt-induced outer membrane protein